MYICPAALEHAQKELRKHFNQFEAVEKAADVVKALHRSPALFIIPDRSNPHGRPVDKGTRFERALETFVAGIVLKGVGKSKLTDLNHQVMKTFQGVMLPNCLRPIRWNGSRLLQSGGGIVAWQITFETLVKTGD